MRPARRNFRDKDQLAEALADAVAGNLKAGVKARGAASLAVSGGTTPARFFKALSARADVPWEKVTVTLVDERWVDEASDRSNARLVRAGLLQGRALAATFVPLFQGGAEPDAGKAGVAQSRVPQPLDAAILGMGNDGHTASFFPGGDTLEEALTGDGPVVAIRAPGAGEPRVTLTLKRLLAARALYLHIEGEEKVETLERAAAEGPVEDMPVRAILRQTQTPLTIFWCP
ncbi:MAG: 6-phosphogluconolactonase [Devosia nanyangense]|uniref:6-phosphogluconolactonase n=1 Tax=Devosia nanyangense TaxID=1228055 RepID=A0A933NXN6_9HYPH|nr:6-phosphogluconolactonase [Devosia nanyangense]